MAEVLLVMGVAGAGKTTVGRLLAEALEARFVEGDELHPERNVAKMRRGEPLDDEDRAPWLDALAAELEASARRGEAVVLACSALRRRYRDRLRLAAPALAVLHLEADAELLRGRLGARSGHFFGPSLLDSQLSTLEPPGEDERLLALDASLPASTVVARALSALRAGPGPDRSRGP